MSDDGVTNLTSLTLSGTLIAPSIIGTVASNSAVIATPDNGTTQTLTAAMVSGGGAWTFHTSTGGSTPTLTMPTAAALIAGITGWAIGDSYVLRIINQNSGTATLAANTGLTITGALTIGTNGTSDFVITYTAANTVTMVKCNQAPSTINGLTITASTGTLTIANAKTLTASNTLTLAGTDSTTMTFPSTSATIARTDAANTFTGTQTVGALIATTVNGNTFTTGTGTLTIAASKTLTANNSLTLAGTDSTTMTFPSASGTVVTTTSIGSVQTVVGAAISANSGSTGTTLTNITGLTVPVLVGTYAFRAYLPGTSTANGGLKIAIANSGTTTSASYSGRQQNGTTNNAETTTTTMGNAIAAATTVFTDAYIDGVVVVSGAGNLTVQFAQNVSHADTTTINANSYFTVMRIA